MQLHAIVTHPANVAVTLRRHLVPLDGADVPVFPPTYPAPEKGAHRFETPYTINELRDGRRLADLDSVQSQANRMEAAFSGRLAHLVPQHQVQAGDHVVALVDLPHRLCDAAARATDLKEPIRQAMLAYAGGDATPVAKLCPTALIYGAWDSRDTQIKIPRAVRSEIRAHDVSLATRSAQFTGTFNAAALGLDAKEWKKGADVGFAPTPSVNAHGGVYVHGSILHSASIMLPALRRGADATLSTYLLGLTLAGLAHAMVETRLRVGCELLPAEPACWELVRADGTRTPLAIDFDELEAALKQAAADWASAVGLALGAPAEIHHYDPNTGKAMIKTAEKNKE